MEAILGTRKMKLKSEHIKIRNRAKIHIEPYDKSRDNLYFVM